MTRMVLEFEMNVFPFIMTWLSYLKFKTDIPIYPSNTNNSKIQALHVLFSLYAEFKNSQHFQNLAEKNEIEGSGNAVAEKLDLDRGED